VAVLSESGYMRRSTDLRSDKFRGLTCGCSCTQNAKMHVDDQLTAVSLQDISP
jgi:hypothetical protein